MKTAYFIRYTETPELDLARGTSLHMLNPVDICTKEEQAKQLCVDESEIVEFNNCWAQVIDGICGFELEAENEEDAIIEASEFKGNYSHIYEGMKYYVFTGVLASNDLPDGDVFIPTGYVK